MNFIYMTGFITSYLLTNNVQVGRFEPPERNYPVARIQNAESTLPPVGKGLRLTGVETARPF